MKRLQDLNAFYEILDKIESKTGKRTLGNSSARSGWPLRGVYFFFEEGEFRQTGDQQRVVRVGTHAIREGVNTKLWERLKQHFGTIEGQYGRGGGKHRSSVFRKHVGAALIERDGIRCDTWGKGSSAGSEITSKEHFLEIKVSERIRSMPFLWLKADDEPSHQSIREIIEKNSIILLSNYMRPKIDPPSSDWLGHHCNNHLVRQSGLWNDKHVKKEHYSQTFLRTFNNLVEAM